MGGDEHIHSDPARSDDLYAEIDRLNVTALHFQTTAKVALDRPTLVGGMTLEPSTGIEGTKGDARQLYLVLEVNLAEGAAHPQPAK